MVYQECFSDWADVQNEFKTDYPEPDHVILAVYNQPDYEGYAAVFFKNGEKYYHASGSHCSCYGLEGQFEPEEYENAELLIAALKKGHWFYIDPEDVIRRIEALEGDDWKAINPEVF